MKFFHLPRILSAIASFLLLISPSALISGQQPAPGSKTVLLRLTAVDDQGQAIPGLKQEQFSIFEKKDQLQITSFDTSNEPISIVLMLDVSGSIPALFKAAAAQLAYRFAHPSQESNDYLVIAFSKQPRLLCDWGCRGDDLKKALLDVAQMTPQMDTAFYDACDLALTKLEASKYTRRVIMVFTDGMDNASKTTFRRVHDRMRESSVGFYPIGMIDQRAGNSLGMEGRGILDEFASITGGMTYYPRERKELNGALDLISYELKHQYIIGVNIAHATRDNKWHPIKIKVAPTKDSRGRTPKVYLRYREGYYDR